jgi:hypothetical protein
VRRWGGRAIRRLGLLPSGEPDGLGDDDSLRGTRLPFEVMVYFGDTRTNLYQLRQWYAPLAALAARHSVGVVCVDSKVAATVRGETALPVVCCGRVATLDDLVSRSEVALALYVNHSVRNFHPLRFATMLHAYLGHGESDKAASASNQVKAYDFVLVPGEAGRQRLARTLLRYDADAHVRLVGRPQLDAPAAPDTAAGEPPIVLYAPTWEGAQPSMAYSSVRSHGERLVRAVLDSGRYRLVYRPHPRTGENDARYAVADRELRALVQRAGQRVDLRTDWDPRRSSADVLVCDVSAVAGDWLATGRPVVVTVPASPAAHLDADSVLSVVPTLSAQDAAQVVDVLERAMVQPGDGRLTSWVTHRFGDVSPGAATALFVDTCAELVALRQRCLAARDAGRPR